jgi:hypothetical protein
MRQTALRGHGFGSARSCRVQNLRVAQTNTVSARSEVRRDLVRKITGDGVSTLLFVWWICSGGGRGCRHAPH